MKTLTAVLAALTLAWGWPAAAQEAVHDEHEHEDHDHEDHEHEEGGHHMVEASGVRVEHAWTRATSDDTALVFADVTNISDGPITLTGAEAPFAAEAALVGFMLVDGEETYQEIGQLPFSPGVEAKLEPQGPAIRLDGLAHPLVRGDILEVELAFDSGPVHVYVDVEAATATQHSHAGHHHH